MNTEDQTGKFPPQHMDKWSRNARLYENLLKMGLVCSPIFADGNQDRIDAIYVSTELPLKTTAEAGVIMPVKGAKIADRITPSASAGDNVVHFPPVL